MNLAFVAPLIKDMMQADPRKRPTLADVIDRLSKIRSSMGSLSLRSRLIPVKEGGAAKIFRGTYHSFWTVYQMMLRRSAVPNAQDSAVLRRTQIFDK